MTLRKKSGAKKKITPVVEEETKSVAKKETKPVAKKETKPKKESKPKKEQPKATQESFDKDFADFRKKIGNAKTDLYELENKLRVA